MYYYGARYYDPRISIFVSVDPLAEDFVGWTPYHYVHNNPIMFIDPTGMSAESADGGIKEWWNKAKSLFSSSTKPVTNKDEVTVLDEVVVNANRKPNWFQRNFSKHKLSNDWKNIKEKSGANHLVNWLKNQNYDGGYYMYDRDSGVAKGDQSLRKRPHLSKQVEAIDVSGLMQLGSFAKRGTGIGSIKSVTAPINTVNNTLSGMDLGSSIGEETNNIRVMFYDTGRGDSLPRNLTPAQNSLLRDNTPDSERFRDSLKRIKYFNALK